MTSPEAGLPFGDRFYIGILSVLLVLILTLNGFVLATLAKHRPLRTGVNLPILSLALADMCIALFVIPGQISGRFSEEYLGNILCMGCSYASFTSMAAAVFSLSVISLARLKTVAYPLKPKPTFRQAAIVLTILWLGALVYGLRGALTFSLTEIVMETADGKLVPRVICGVGPMNLTQNWVLAGLDFFIIFFIPSLIVSVSYIALLVSLSKHAAQTNLQEMNTNNNNSNHHSNKTNRKAVRMSIFIISVFLLCHLPEHAIRVYMSRDTKLIPESINLMLAFNIIVLLNSVLNPVFYGFMNPKVREGFPAICGAWRGKTRLSFHHTGTIN